jgi:creatinine amidohydrolase
MSQPAPVRFKTIFLDENLPDDKRINQLIYRCRRFHKLGLAPKSAGNLSFRTKNGFIITGTGFELNDIKKENLAEVLEVKIGKNQILVYAKGRVVPSKESILHWEIYNLKPEINVVFHLHDQKVLESADKLKIPCTKREQPRGSYEQVEEVRKLLNSRKDIYYFVLKNHGIISMGKTMEEAGRLAELVHEEVKMKRMPEFEENAVGNLKKEIWQASDAEIDKILKEYEIPSLGEREKPGCYIQNTHPDINAQRREKNDIVMIPLGSTENHGAHSVSGQDTIQVCRLIEGVRRYTQKKGWMVNLAEPPWVYGNHPKHHVGMLGTIPISESTLRQQLVDVMVGLFHEGYRKMVFVNNHAQHWVIVQAIDDYLLRYPELSGIFPVIVDWCCAVWEFFQTKEKGGPFDENFIHADEVETSLMLLLAPEMIDMSLAIDTRPRGYLPDGYFNKSANQLAHRPSLWYGVRNNVPLEIVGTPEGVLGSATKATAEKAKRPVAAALRYMTLLCEDILRAFPSGKTPPIEEVTLFSRKEIEGYYKKPGEKGYKNPYRLWRPY